ncbi:MAG: peptidase and DD-carboxypeptidase VanY/endolysin [Frankiales bacterium]|nr:peptidase and DD-carboxypeptidase VanY/endolysin [Frankiales bacterium]
MAAGVSELNPARAADVVRAVQPGPGVVTPNGVGDVEHLQPKVRSAIQRAIAAAAADGVELRVTSGWRSKDHQQRLYDEAIAKYGSPEAARMWVLPPDESAHVDGAAVDVGPAEGARWLEANGEQFGLCRRYANESWHFERLAGARGSRCPALEPHP